ncbi:MAG TPA: ABC transporter permease [Thermoanaerobaculia bacterium]|jgi:predicted permease|nr:ABC transporter permease [Thermoanaerobaculia bacterium]
MRIEHWWFTAPLRLRSLFRRRQVEQELDEELQFHLEHLVEEGIAQGLAPAEARRRALLAMGGIEQRKEEVRDTRRVSWLTDFVADFRYALRSLRRTPALTGFVVVTLALGIGMTSTPFSMLDGLVFRPYPVPHPRNVVSLVSTSHDNPYDFWSYREYLDLRAQAKSYDGVVAHTTTVPIGFSRARGATPQVRGGMLVSANFFSVLGVEPHVGRGFRADEDVAPGRDAVTVLGPDFWKREFASDPAVVGKKVRVNGTEFTVVGVAPESFPSIQQWQRPDVYLPLAMAHVFSTDPQKSFFADRDDRELLVKARLAPAATLARARTEIAGLARDFARENPALYRDRSAAVRTQREMQTRGDRQEWKFIAIGQLLGLAVLLVACTNVAGLLLSRARTRTREIAIRLALGSGRSRLVRLLLTESLVLAVLGAAGGIAIAYFAIGLINTFQIPTDIPVVPPFQFDLRVLIASLVVASSSALLCGLAPALQSTRGDLVNGLKSSDVDAPGRKRLWGRNALVVAQVATSLMLITACFVMARDFRQAALGTTGFAKDHLLMVRFDSRLVQYDAVRTKEFYDLLERRAAAAAGVTSVALTESPPLSLDAFEALSFVPEGFQMPRDRESFTSAMDTVDEGYFATMGVPILRGRGFLRADTAEAPRVAIVNERLAERYWPGQDAVGKRIRLDHRGGPPVEIVGVARTIKYRAPTERPTDFVYLPLAQHRRERLVLLLRTTGDPLRLADPVRDIARTLAPDMPVVEMRTYENLVRYHTVEGPGIAIQTIGTMGAVGVLLAMAGLYGLVSYNVNRRTRELGIRMAIGAGRGAVLRLVIGKGLCLVLIGTAIGLVLAFGIERVLSTAIFGSGGVDVAVYLVAVPSMLAVTMLAAYVPALRASRIAPTLALRYD